MTTYVMLANWTEQSSEGEGLATSSGRCEESLKYMSGEFKSF